MEATGQSRITLAFIGILQRAIPKRLGGQPLARITIMQASSGHCGRGMYERNNDPEPYHSRAHKP
jgi:hypothetical protein